MSDQQRVEEAIADPTRRFQHPSEVLADDSLGDEDKRRILESWKKDAELLATAQAENMAGACGTATTSAKSFIPPNRRRPRNCSGWNESRPDWDG